MLSTDKQTDKQTDKLTNATKNITSFAKEVNIHFTKYTEFYVQDCVCNDIYLAFIHLCFGHSHHVMKLEKMHGVLKI